MTLVESKNPLHQKIANDLISRCLPLSGNSIRIAISGPPGVGKSTLIGSLGLHVISRGRKPAILAVDPSSDITHGSILGDKTRMEQLSKNESAYIRPSPAGGNLGGVAKSTIESIILCETAGYDTIFIETVGVGQSETFAQKMADIFILLVSPGSGDELQGIKRGIVELADIIAVNKVEKERKTLSDATLKAYSSAIHLASPKENGWTVRVIPCSALEQRGLNELWAMILSFEEKIKSNDFFEENRKRQNIFWATHAIQQRFQDLMETNSSLHELKEEIILKIRTGELSPEKAAQTFLNKLIIDVKE